MCFVSQEIISKRSYLHHNLFLASAYLEAWHGGRQWSGGNLSVPSVPITDCVFCSDQKTSSCLSKRIWWQSLQVIHSSKVLPRDAMLKVPLLLNIKAICKIVSKEEYVYLALFGAKHYLIHSQPISKP